MKKKCVLAIAIVLTIAMLMYPVSFSAESSSFDARAEQPYSDHTWVDYTTYFKCSVCGRKETNIAANALLVFKDACLIY